jgi:hypothetical protein
MFIVSIFRVYEIIHSKYQLPWHKKDIFKNVITRVVFDEHFKVVCLIDPIIVIEHIQYLNIVINNILRVLERV